MAVIARSSSAPQACMAYACPPNARCAGRLLDRRQQGEARGGKQPRRTSHDWSCKTQTEENGKGGVW